MYRMQTGLVAVAVLALATAGAHAAEAAFPQYQCTNDLAASGLEEARASGDVALFYSRFSAAVAAGQCSVVSAETPKRPAVRVAKSHAAQEDNFPPAWLFLPRR